MQHLRPTCALACAEETFHGTRSVKTYRSSALRILMQAQGLSVDDMDSDDEDFEGMPEERSFLEQISA